MENGDIKNQYLYGALNRLYNFNRGQADIASGVSDNVNGIFAELGWAKSFITYGETTLTISWTEGNIENGKIEGECDDGR